MHTLIKILIKCVICLHLFQSTKQLISTEIDINNITLNDCLNNDVWNDCKLFVDSKRNVSQILATTNQVPNGRWDTAMWVCNKYDSRLVSIESQEKWKFIYSYFEEGMTYWTSGRKNIALGKWIWNTTGVEFTFTDWYERATPSDSIIKCLSIWGKVYKWNDDSCNYRRRIMCEFDINVNRINPNTNREGINTETNLNDNTLYDCLTSGVWYDCALFIDHNTNNSKIIAKPRTDQNEVTWREAVYICNNLNSSSLSIESEEKWKFLQSFIADDGSPYFHWTSGRKNNDGKWKWNANGKEFTFTNWPHREYVSPLAYERQVRCLSFAEELWFNHMCNSRHSVMCEFDVNSDQKTANTNTKPIGIKTDNKTPDACFQSDLWFDCKLFVDNDKNIIQIIAKPRHFANVYTWSEAMNICAKYNSSLVSIESEEKQDFIELFFNQGFYWTSGRHNLLLKWIWNSNGNEISYSNWPSSDYILTENEYIECLSIFGPLWYRTSCLDTFYVLCEYNV